MERHEKSGVHRLLTFRVCQLYLYVPALITVHCSARKHQTTTENLKGVRVNYVFGNLRTPTLPLCVRMACSASWLSTRIGRGGLYDVVQRYSVNNYIATPTSTRYSVRETWLQVHGPPRTTQVIKVQIHVFKLGLPGVASHTIICRFKFINISVATTGDDSHVTPHYEYLMGAVEIEPDATKLLCQRRRVTSRVLLLRISN